MLQVAYKLYELFSLQENNKKKWKILATRNLHLWCLSISVSLCQCYSMLKGVPALRFLAGLNKFSVHFRFIIGFTHTSSFWWRVLWTQYSTMISKVQSKWNGVYPRQLNDILLKRVFLLVRLAGLTRNFATFPTCGGDYGASSFVIIKSLWSL